MSPMNIEANSARDEIQISKTSDLEQIQLQHENHAVNKVGEERMSTMDTEAPLTSDGPSRFRTFAVMSGLCSAVFVSALNQTIIATAIPTICSDLDSSSGYTWISAAYLLANAISAPIWSKLSDIWGRKLILLTAVAFYFCMSIICAASRDMNMLIIGRTFQGVAGGGLIQIVYATISDIFSMRSRTFYLGFLQLVWATAGGVGPIAGGLLSQYTTWRWIFWINLPITGLSFAILLIFLDVHNPRTKLLPGLQAVDWFGSLSILSFMVLLLLGLNFGGSTFAWDSPVVICLMVFGLVMAVVFLLSEKRAKYPLIPLDLFSNPSNIAALVIGFTHDWCVFSTEFYLPLYFQSVKSTSPLESGVLIIPVTLIQALVGICGGLIVYKSGRYMDVMRIGVMLLTLGNGLYINLSDVSPIGKIIAFEIVAAAGAGFLFQPPLIALQAHVGPKRTASATATLGLVRNLATSLSIVVSGVAFSNGMDKQSHVLLEKGLSSNLTASFTGSGAAAHVMLVRAIEDPIQQLAVKEAYATSLRSIWVLCTCMASCSVIACAFVVKKELSKVHVEHRTGLEKSETGAVSSQI